jgi:transposase InsO family protein
VNRKRVHRIWQREGLQVPVTRRKKRRLGHGEHGVVRKRPEHVGHVWSLDFVYDETEDGRQLRWLSVLEEFSRFNLALEVRRSFRSVDVIAVLERLVEEYGFPKFIRCDNGPEFIAKALRKWLEASGVGALYIEPGSPWENGYVESFNGTLRNELLDREVFSNLLEAQLLGVEYRDTYNHERPHSSLADLTPAEFMAQHPREGADRVRSAEAAENEAQNRSVTNATEPGIHLGTPEITVGLS